MNGLAMATGLSREIAPPGYESWEAEPRKVDPLARFQEGVKAWETLFANATAKFKEHVYENPNPTVAQFRMHRKQLAYLIFNGDELLFQGAALCQAGGVDEALFSKEAEKVEHLIEELSGAFVKWHAPIDSREEFSQCIIDALKEAKAGQLVPFNLDERSGTTG